MDRNPRGGIFKSASEGNFVMRTTRAWAWLLGMLWLGVVFAGMAIALTPSRYPPTVGWGLLAIAAIVFVTTMDRWIRSFAVLILAAALRAASTIVLGHLPENPNKSIPTVNAVFMTAFLVASAYLVFTIGEHRLKIHHRVALLGFTCGLFWGMADEPRTMLAITLAFAFLVLSWVYDRLTESLDDYERIQGRKGH